jgi:hypothetical protein
MRPFLRLLRKPMIVGLDGAIAPSVSKKLLEISENIMEINDLRDPARPLRQGYRRAARIHRRMRQRGW